MPLPLKSPPRPVRRRCDRRVCAYGVYLLSAGRPLQTKLGRTRIDEEPLLPTPTWLPYERDALERALADMLWQLKAITSGAIGVAALLAFLGWAFSPIFYFAAAARFLWFGVFAVHRSMRVIKLNRVYQESLSTAAKVPSLQSSNPEPVSWWELLKAGFDSRHLWQHFLTIE